MYDSSMQPLGLAGLGLGADALVAVTSHQQQKVEFEGEALAMDTSFDGCGTLSRRPVDGLLEQLIAVHGPGACVRSTSCCDHFSGVSRDCATPHTRRVMCSTSCTCLSDAGWCL